MTKLATRGAAESGVDPVTVSEGTAIQALQQWEKIPARIVYVGGTNVITGGLLFRSTSQRRSFTPCSTSSTAPHSTNPAASPHGHLRFLMDI